MNTPLYLKNLPHGTFSLFTAQKPIRLHAMVSSSGFSLETVPSAYNWNGLKRGKAEFALFQYCITGRGMLDYEGVTHEILPGNAMLVHVPHRHRYWLEKGDTWEFVWVVVHGTECMRICKAVEKQAGPILTVEARSPLIKKVCDIVLYASSYKEYSPLVLSGHAYDVCMLLAGEFLQEQHGTIRSERITKVIDFCRNNLEDPPSVAMMADYTGMSRFHFAREFKRSEGTSPAEYLMNVRIEEAAQRLREEAVSIKEVAYKCGFASPNYFCKVFRKKTGIAPGSFRRSGAY